MPAAMATWLPKLRGKRIAVTRLSTSRSVVRMSNDASVLPSSTKTNSQSYSPSWCMTTETSS